MILNLQQGGKHFKKNHIYVHTLQNFSPQDIYFHNEGHIKGNFIDIPIVYMNKLAS